MIKYLNLTLENLCNMIIVILAVNVKEEHIFIWCNVKVVLVAYNKSIQNKLNILMKNLNLILIKNMI